MVKFLAVTLAFGALLSHLPAVAARGFTNFPSEFKVGQLVHLTWSLNPGEEVGRLTLQHENARGEVLQYETICQWDDASGLNGKGAGVTSIDWIPNVAGPSFHLILEDNSVASPVFSILAADGSYVSTVPAGIDRFSNIEPQTATPIWYPNDPHKTAAATTQSPLLSSISLVAIPGTPLAATSTVVAEAASTPATPAAASTVSVGSASTLSSVIESASPLSTAAAAATTLATSSLVPIKNATITPLGNSTAASITHTPTAVFTGAAVAMRNEVEAAVLAVAGYAVAWSVL